MSRDYTADGTCTRVPRFGLIGSAVVVLNEDDLIAVGQRHARPQEQRDERERGGADGNRERERLLTSVSIGYRSSIRKASSDELQPFGCRDRLNACARRRPWT